MATKWILGLTILLDVGGSVCLNTLLATPRKDNDDDDFHCSMWTCSSADLLLLSSFRFVVLILLNVVAQWVLLGGSTEVRGEHERVSTVEPVGNDGAALLEWMRKRSRKRQGNSKIRSAMMACVFTTLTACSITVALKCLTFHYAHSPFSEITMALTVLWVNIEILCVQRVLNGAIDVSDIYDVRVHPHTLRFRHDVQGYICDACRELIQREGFKCPTCEYDICMNCYRERRSTAPNDGNGDNAAAGGGAVASSHDTSAPARDEGRQWRTYVQRMASFLAPFSLLLILSFVLAVMNEVVRVLIPRSQGVVIDAIIARQGMEEFVARLLVFCILSACTLVLGSAHSFCVKLVMRQLTMGVRNRLFEKIIYKEVAFFDSTAVGSLTSRFTNDAEGMLQPVDSILRSTLPCLISLIGGAAMCFVVSWRLAMVSVTIAGPILIVGQAYTWWSFFIYRRMWNAFSEATRLATEAFTNIRTVRAFSTEESEIRRFGAAITRALQSVIQDAVIFSTVDIATNVMSLSANIIILGFGGYMIFSRHTGSLTVGRLVTFQLYANVMSNAYESLLGIAQVFATSGGAAERVMEMLDDEGGVDPNAGEKLDHPLLGELVLRDVTFAYASRPNQTILRRLTLVCKPNTVTAIVGHSGGGKSTIMSLLLRLYDPLEGSVLVDSHDLRGLSLPWVHQQMAVVSQETHLFNDTIEANITYGLDQADVQEMYEAARGANAHDFISELPEGYRTIVGERGVRLSGGQRQRIAVARALLRRPKVLLLDEATSALDTESEALVQQALDQLIAGLHTSCTIVVIAHRLSTIIGADSIAVMSEGAIVQQGSHNELLRDTDGVYWRLINKQL